VSYLFSGSTCKVRWNNVRDNYRKSLKKTVTKSGQRAKQLKLYKYSEQLSFLKNYFKERVTKGNIDSPKDEEDDQGNADTQRREDKEETAQDDAEEPTVSDLNEDFQIHPPPSIEHESTSEVPGTSTTRKSSGKKVALQQTGSAKLLEYLIRKDENAATTSSAPHPVDAFLAGVAPTLKALGPYYLNLAKSEIFASIQKYEMKMLMQQHSYEGTSASNVLHNITHLSEHYSTSSSTASTPLLSPTPAVQENTSFQEYLQNSSPCTAIPNSTDNSFN
jgi:hypothetical protein